MSKKSIELKGTNFTLLVVYLYSSQPEIIHHALKNKINQAPSFLLNAPVVINISSLDENIDWNQIQKAINMTGLYIIGVSGCKDKSLKRAITRAGLPILSEGKENQNRFLKNISLMETKSFPIVDVVSKTHIVNTLVRSGQQIYTRNADLIVTNSVSTGAELVADGNIHIYGTMRGRALAGASGNRQCQIFCTNLAAELVSISGEYWIMDQIPAEFFGKAARLYLKDNVLAIQKLN